MRYAKTEERLNIITHAFGVIMSVPATFLLLKKAESFVPIVGAAVFGASLFVLYLASTLYHATQNEQRRRKMRIADHSAIFLLIAGTYTPICLTSLWETWGQHLLILIWSIAVAGIVLKLIFTGRFDRASTILYVAMGWIALIAIKPLLDALSIPSLLWLLAGGICYTLGALLYSIRRIPFNHAIFHVFVLGGSLCHYLMIYWYVI